MSAAPPFLWRTILDEPDVQKLILAAGSLALSESLAHTLRALAVFHGNKTGQWLDDLERDFIYDIMSSHTEGFAIETELKVIDGAISLITLAVNNARSEIASRSKNN